MRPKMNMARAGVLLSLMVLAMGCGRKSEQRGGVTSGREHYQLCERCHGPSERALCGDGNEPDLCAPAIAGLQDWYIKAQLEKFREGTRGNHFDDIAGMRMRPMAVSLPKADLGTVASYVSAMPVTAQAVSLHGGDAARGKDLYAPCTACHGQKGEGLQQMNAPALTITGDRYMLSQLKNFKTGVRGADPRDVTGASMAPMMSTLQDEQAMLDVVAHIMTLK